MLPKKKNIGVASWLNTQVHVHVSEFTCAFVSDEDVVFFFVSYGNSSPVYLTRHE